VHLYTASGVALLALSARLLLEGRFEGSLALMLLAVVVDATDGMLARRFDVKGALPEFDGRRMDDVIDYVSYVFLPVLFLLRAGMLARPEVAWAAMPLVASAFGFARVDAKLDEEGFFLGFPSYWNIVAFYCFMFALPPWLNTLIIAGLAALVFVPTRYMYISRLPSLRWPNYGLTVAWGASIGLSLVATGDLRSVALASSLPFPIYYVAGSLLLDRRARMRAGRRP
jgi:phosphatidylcholine synthase